MIVSTFLNLAITPVIYVIVKSWEQRRRRCVFSDGNGKVRGGYETPQSVTPVS